MRTLKAQLLFHVEASVSVLLRVFVSGPIVARAAASPRQKVAVFWGGARQALTVDKKRVRKDAMGLCTPSRCVDLEP
jgi:hypothetical protein